ncbi:type IV secretion system DNA-binding domain-containing protein [Actinoplanes sp. NBC_00393]|uniref:type IV secretory system conjugative DNA transfer family protein n=1 Tax=Actinoplanes sp. NBC_00393 TaxID=2975953 RepID=UPI002E226699
MPAPPDSWLVDALTATVSWLMQRPWLALTLPLIILVGTATSTQLRRRRHRRLTRHAHEVMITPPPQVEPAGATTWWANLYELLTPSLRRRVLLGIPHVAFEYRWTGRQLTIHVWLPGTVSPGPVAAAVRAAWPGATATITDAAAPLPISDHSQRAHDEGGLLAPTLPAWYPLETDHDADPTRALIAAGTSLARTEDACVQILARPASPRRITQLRRGAAALRTGRPTTGLLDPVAWLRAGLDLATELLTPVRSPHPTRPSARPLSADPVRDRDARLAMDKALAPQWEVSLRYAVAARPGRGADADVDAVRRRLVTLAHGLASAFGTYTGRNRLRRRPLAQPAAVLAQRRLSRGFLLSAAELAALATLPTDVAVPGLDRARAKAAPAPIAVPGGGRNTTVLGRAEVGGHTVALRTADARQHVHLLGATGSGKSTLMTHLVLDDVKARRGVVVIDPKGDLALDILDRLPADVADRLVIIDPDQPGGATLNPLLGADPDLVVDNIVSIFSRIFQRHWGPRIDDVLRVACLTLMRRPKPRLTRVPPLLNDRKFRADYIADLDDPEGLKGFWEWYESTPPQLRAQVIGPVLARLRSFLLRDFVRRTLGTPKSSFDMARVLDGGILIARLPKGQLGEETAKLMGSLVFASVWQAATARAGIPEDKRRDACLYADEAHNVLNLAGSVGDMLAEARGYRLSLVLAHQNLTQLPRDIQLALSANARNKVYFNCSPEDAHQLARHTQPELDEHDLSHLDAYTAAARLVVANRETAAFTLRTLPPAPLVGEADTLRRAVARTAPVEPPDGEHDKS